MNVRHPKVQILHEGKTLTLRELAAATQISYDTLYYRFYTAKLRGPALIATPSRIPYQNRSTAIQEASNDCTDHSPLQARHDPEPPGKARE